MKRAALTLLFVLAGMIVSTPEAVGQRTPGQAVTWRNFDYVRAVTSSNSHVYYATSGGIIRYDKLRRQWELPLTGADGTPTEDVQQLWVDQFGQTLFLGTELALYEYDAFFDRWTSITELPQLDNQISHVPAPDILTPQFDAIYRGQGEFVDFFSRRFETTDIVQDAVGDLWIGTWGFGPARGEVLSGLMELLPYGLLQNQVDVILPDDTVLWLAGEIRGDFRTGLTSFDPSGNRFSYIESGLTGDFPANDVYCLQADSAWIYVGTPRGLYRLNKSDHIARGPLNSRRGLPDDFVTSLALTGESLYVGTAGGLSLLRLRSDSLVRIWPETFRRQIIYDLEVVDNTVWIASSAGAFRYTPENDRLQQFQDSDLVLFHEVLNVEHYGSAVWLAADEGVVRLDLNTGKSEAFREPSSLRDRRALAVNDRLIALAVNNGVALIIPGRKKTRTVKLTTNDGLSSDDIRTLYLGGDYLWIGSDRGLTRFLWNDPRWVD
ncbi:MAG: hypothetical protein AB1772_01740 [Candidatus Zixiibacteriota bacterium]